MTRRHLMALIGSLVSVGAGAGCGSAPPAAPPRAAALPVASLPGELLNNLLLVGAAVNASPPLTFILDTGASTTVIDRATAGRLRLPLGSAGRATTGGGTVDLAEITGVTLTVGDVRLAGLTVAAIDLSGLQAGLGRHVDGILGYELFERYVVEIDYAATVVRLYEPGAFTYQGDGAAMPLHLEEQTPFVTVRLRTPAGTWVDARLEFDTGQTGALTLTRPFTESHQLVDPRQPRLRITTGALRPGAVPAEVTRVPAVQIGTVLLERPLVTVTPDADAAGVSGGTVGLLGGEVLRRFRLFVDYSRGRALLEPNINVSAEMPFDASGMSLAAVSLDPPAYRVRTVVEGSPAMRAGVQVGDVLAAVNGTPAMELSLAAIRQLLREPGREVELRVRRGSQAVRVRLRTARLV